MKSLFVSTFFYVSTEGYKSVYKPFQQGAKICSLVVVASPLGGESYVPLPALKPVSEFHIQQFWDRI